MRAFQHGQYASDAFDIEWFDLVTDENETWTPRAKQSETWTPRAKQSETWTVNYDY
jgi:hypothetical protein